MESVEDIKARMKEDMAERKRLKKEARAKGEVDARMVDDDDFDVNFTVVDFSKIDHGMGNKKFTSKFSFMQRDGKGKLDKRWDAGDVNDGGGDFWKNDGPSATEQAAAEKAEKKAAKKEARKKLKEEALAHEDEDTASPKAEKLKKKKKAKKSKAGKGKDQEGSPEKAKFANPMDDDDGLSDEDAEGDEQARIEAMLSGKNAYFE